MSVETARPQDTMGEEASVSPPPRPVPATVRCATSRSGVSTNRESLGTRLELCARRKHAVVDQAARRATRAQEAASSEPKAGGTVDPAGAVGDPLQAQARSRDLLLGYAGWR